MSSGELDRRNGDVVSADLQEDGQDHDPEPTADQIVATLRANFTYALEHELNGNRSLARRDTYFISFLDRVDLMAVELEWEKAMAQADELKNNLPSTNSRLVVAQQDVINTRKHILDKAASIPDYDTRRLSLEAHVVSPIQAQVRGLSGAYRLLKPVADEVLDMIAH